MTEYQKCRTFVVFFIFFTSIFFFSFTPQSNEMVSYRDSTDNSSLAGPVYRTRSYPSIIASPGNMSLLFHPLLVLLRRWSPNDPSPPLGFTESLQHFNYSDPYQRSLAELYRRAEIPFKVYDIPDLNKASVKWTRGYLSSNLHHMRYHVEESPSNRFMYWTTAKKRVGEKYEPPTKVITDDTTFDSWSRKAEHADAINLAPSQPHQYFMSGSQRSDDRENFIHRDLPMYRSDQPNLFIPTPEHNRGIQCRFGMRGIIAEAHFDNGRNSVAMVRGSKRYILTPPESCGHLAIISDKNHPSFRHSMIDFANLKQIHTKMLQRVKSIETIVRVGEVLYIPSFWFHYIVSLNYSIQCNARSGLSDNKEGKNAIEKCMNLKIPH
mmetsp:Transcript_13249/g.21694  ORF Transcript_13249/g.21694 Transcript_13249/m.21694 type:complete len:379 (+) Transcript_13249:102-1238(+)